MTRTLFFKAGNSKIIISLFVLLLCWSCLELGCQAQDDFQDDAGADTTGSDATNDMLDQDPNTVNPQKNQNSGLNIPTNSDFPDNLGKGKNGKKGQDTKSQKSIADQTVQAALQFGVLVGVSLMVVVLFFLSVWADMLCTSVSEKFTAKFAKIKPVDIEDQDPASLVGSFKRYK